MGDWRFYLCPLSDFKDGCEQDRVRRSSSRNAQCRMFGQYFPRSFQGSRIRRYWHGQVQIRLAQVVSFSTTITLTWRQSAQLSLKLKPPNLRKRFRLILTWRTRCALIVTFVKDHTFVVISFASSTIAVPVGTRNMLLKLWNIISPSCETEIPRAVPTMVTIIIRTRILIIITKISLPFLKCLQ